MGARPGLARALSYLPHSQLEAVLEAPRYHVDHPLKWLLEGTRRPDSLQEQVLGNMEMATRSIVAARNLDNWLSAKVRAAAQVPEEDDVSQAYSRLSSVCAALAEIRAFGYLRQCNVEVTPRSGKGSDLTVGTGKDEMSVEVSAILMNKDEAQALFDFHNPRASCCNEIVVYPAGSPKPGEFTVDNIAHKFSQKAEDENHQLPEDRPSILWFDLQFEDWRSLGANEAWPLYILRNGRFRTGGVWLGFYGKRGTRFMESESTKEGLPPDARGIKYRSLRYPGYFQTGKARASAVVLSWPCCTALFENPWAPHPVPRPLLEWLLSLRSLDWPRSWIRPFWKEDQEAVAKLRNRADGALSQIRDVSQIAQLDW